MFQKSLGPKFKPRWAGKKQKGGLNNHIEIEITKSGNKGASKKQHELRSKTNRVQTRTTQGTQAANTKSKTRLGKRRENAEETGRREIIKKAGKHTKTGSVKQSMTHEDKSYKIKQEMTEIKPMTANLFNFTF